MTITLDQAFEAGQLLAGNDGNDSASLPYILQGVTDEAAAVLETAYRVPAAYSGLTFDSVDITGRVGLDAWKVNVNYKEPQGIGDAEIDKFEFSITGQVVNMRQSLQTIAWKNHTTSEDDVENYPPPSFRGGINVTGQGIDGVDVVTPQMGFTKSKRYPIDEVNYGFHKVLSEMVGRVNSDTFFSYAAGEVLITGIHGLLVTAYEYEIFFDFQVSRNATNLQVGQPDFTKPTEEQQYQGVRYYASKEGWDYLWVYYGEYESDSQIVRIPMYSYIERVYYRAPFSLLGLVA